MIRRSAPGQWSSTSSARWRGPPTSVGIDEILARHGHTIPEHLQEMWWSGDIDGIEHVEQSRSPATTTWRGSGSGWWRCSHEADVHPGEHDAILDRPRRPAARSACSRPTTRCPACSRELRDRGLDARDLLELGLGPRTGGRRGRTRRPRSTSSCRRRGRARASRTRASTATCSSRPGLDPAEIALRRRHVGTRRGGPARRGDDARLPRARRALAGRDATRRHLSRAGRARAATCAGLRSRWWDAGCTRRRRSERVRQTTRTFWASSPLRPGPTSNSTR